MTSIPLVDFNLRALIREAIKDAPGAEYAEYAERVAAEVPEEALRDALRQALRPLVREVLLEHRPRGPIARPSGPVPRPSPQGGTPKAVFRFGDNGPAASTGTRKGAEIRDAWQKVLDATYATEDGSRKRLGDCTYNDLQFMAAQLDKQADERKQRARGFRELAALLTDHDAATLGDLPRPVLMQALGAK